jgi:hypothetical protein
VFYILTLNAYCIPSTIFNIGKRVSVCACARTIHALLLSTFKNKPSLIFDKIDT